MEPTACMDRPSPNATYREVGSMAEPDPSMQLELPAQERRAVFFTLLGLGLLAPIATAKVDTVWGLCQSALNEPVPDDAQDEATLRQVAAELSEWVTQRSLLTLVLDTSLPLMLMGELLNLAAEWVLSTDEVETAVADCDEAERVDARRIAAAARSAKEAHQRILPAEELVRTPLRMVAKQAIGAADPASGHDSEMPDLGFVRFPIRSVDSASDAYVYRYPDLVDVEGLIDIDLADRLDEANSWDDMEARIHQEATPDLPEDDDPRTHLHNDLST